MRSNAFIGWLFAATMLTTMIQTGCHSSSSDSAAGGDEAELGIGDANPGISIAKWIKGEPIDNPLKGRIHVVEFWATWCGPCRAGMPHITTLQEKYGDEVVFIGVTREDESTVREFLASPSPDGRTWDQVIGYRLAIDNNDVTNQAYMEASNQPGIPCAFVVGRDGVIEWIGHPAGIDDALEEIVAGTWDREAAIVDFRQQAKQQEIATEISQLSRSGEWKQALELMDTHRELLGDSPEVARYRIQLLESAGRLKEASAAKSELIQSAWDDSQFAWSTATDSGSPDLAIALKAALRAAELTDKENAQVLDVVARCYYELDDLDKAIEYQSLAVEVSNSEEKESIETTLQQYQREKEKLL